MGQSDNSPATDPSGLWPGGDGDAVPVPLAVVDPLSGDILAANRLFGRLLGLPGETAPTGPVTAFYEDPGNHTTLIAALERDGEVSALPVRLRLADGDPIWVAASARFVSAGGKSAIVMAFTDISAERAAREDGLEARRHLDAILNNAGACVFLKDRESRFILANRLLCEFLREAGPADPVGHLTDEYYEPDDAQRLKEQDAQVIRTRAPVRRDEIISVRGGEQRVMRINKFPVLDENGEVAAIGGISLDVTSEHRLRAVEQNMHRLLQSIVDNAPVHISLKNTNGRYILVNRSLRKRFAAITGREDPVGELSLSHFIPGNTEVFAGLDQEVIRTRSSVTRELKVGEKDGHDLTYSITKFPVFDSDGQVTAIGGIGADVTEQRKLEQQLRYAQKMEAVGQLTGGIAHDFNNLLAVMLGNAELLVDDLAADPVRHRMATLILTASHRAADLTRRLLAFSRQQKLDPVVTDCGQLVNDLAGLLRRTVEENVEFEITVEPVLWPVLVDRTELENCLINISLNARDAMASGGAIRIGVGNISVAGDAPPPASGMPSGDYVHLSVSDSGCGMPQDVLARAFDPFFTTKEVGKGTGLGLSMVYGFVKQSNGYAAIHSEPGHGTTVDIYLPRMASQDGIIKKTNVLPTGTEKILVTEDEPLLLAHVAGELRRLGYHVIEATNGQEALQALKAHDGVDLLFTDLIMPGGMRGDELAKKAREIHPALKIVFTTGYAGEVDESALSDGSEATLLKKPYPRRVLAESIRHCLDEAR